MDWDFEASNILYLIGAFLGAVTVLYFGASYVMNLSPVTKSVLLLLAFGFFFVEGLNLYSRDESVLSKLGYLISGVAYLVFLVYTSAKFSFSQEQVLLLLGVSSVLFTGLGYAVREKKFELSGEDSKKILAGLGAVAAVIFVFDVVGAQPEYQLELKDSVTVREDGETILGVLEARNDFVFSRNMDLPEYSACVYTPNRTRGFIRVQDGSGMISGLSTEKMNVTLNAIPRREGENISNTYPVERAGSCPEDVRDRKVVITPGDRGRYERYVD